MTITQYLGTGSVSRGRLDITPQLNTRVITAPYLRNATDKEAVIAGIEHMRGVLSGVANLTWVRPTPEQTTTDFVNSVCFLLRSLGFHLILSTMCLSFFCLFRKGWRKNQNTPTTIFCLTLLFHSS